MEHVIAERTYAEPIDLVALEESLRTGHPCLDTYRVRHLRTYASLDGKRLICEYEAPDAEAVRAVSQRLRIPYDRVWTAKVLVSSKPPQSVG
jgi:Protein of unknown function (DUF4242)